LLFLHLAYSCALLALTPSLLLHLATITPCYPIVIALPSCIVSLLCILFVCFVFVLVYFVSFNMLLLCLFMCNIKIRTFDLNLKPLNLNLFFHDEFFHDEMREKCEWFLDNFSKPWTPLFVNVFFKPLNQFACKCFLFFLSFLSFFWLNFLLEFMHSLLKNSCFLHYLLT
jgi:hypothetical protein